MYHKVQSGGGRGAFARLWDHNVKGAGRAFCFSGDVSLWTFDDLRYAMDLSCLVSLETILATLGVKRLGEILAPFGIRLCEPMLIKRNAEARVAELRLVNNVISEAEDILPEGTRIEYNKEGWRLSTTTDPKTLALRKRSLTRNAAKELIGQYCLEGVIAATAEEAAKFTSVPDEKPDPTFTIRLLGYAEGMADTYLQELWGRFSQAR
jgi:hypothetical protein